MTDTVNRNIIAASLALIGLASVCGIIYLAAVERVVPDALIALGSAAVGALAGVLLPGRST